MKVRFILDENLSPKLQLAVRRFNSDIDIIRLRETEAPILGTLDPELLNYLERSQRLLVTDN